MLDHPYCAKLLEVKVKQEQEELLDRIKEENASAGNIHKDQHTHKNVFKHSIETILACGNASSPINDVGNTKETTIYRDNIASVVNGIQFEHSSNEMKRPNGDYFINSNTPSTPLTSSAATSRTSSPPLPRRMSTRKKKEAPLWTTFKQGKLKYFPINSTGVLMKRPEKVL